MTIRCLVRLCSTRCVRTTTTTTTTTTLSRFDSETYGSVFRAFRRSPFSSLSKFQPLLTLLKSRMEQGSLRKDDAQAQAARRLTRLQDALVGYSNEPVLIWMRLQEEHTSKRMSEVDADVDNSQSEKLTNVAPPDEVPPLDFRIPRGLFLHGHVGTGKSMLMDLFFVHVTVERKRRVHFHSFLQEVHKRIYDLKQRDLQATGRNFHVDTSVLRNPIVRVAKQLASEVSLLCFDEFQVTDVADALIMKQLFEILFQCGTVVVATSNRPPSDLYEGGLNRSYFLPFIDLLQIHCLIHEIKSETDYRRLLSNDVQDCFLVDNGNFATSEQAIDAIFDRLLDGVAPVTMDLPVSFNRSVMVPQAHSNRTLVCRFPFDNLCNRELGSSDYRAIAEQFSVVIVERIPLLTLKEHDQARRFITLIDELYEGKCALICSAVADPDHLFVDHTEAEMPDSDSMEAKVGELFGVDVAQNTGRTVGKLASVKELSFAFRRAASRLTEMCSRNWWNNATDKSPG